MGKSSSKESAMGKSTSKESDSPPPYTAAAIMPTTKIDGVAQDPDLVLETSAAVTVDKIPTVLLKIQPTNGISRNPIHICCVVDISGSMEEIATFQNESGSRESDGLIILDLVKHAIRTILTTMTSVDMLSIVSFSSNALMELEPILMDIAGKQKALKVLEELHTEGSTNLWGGLELGLDTVRNHQSSSKTNNLVESVFLFTDGQPNVIPPRGHMPMIRMYKDKHNLPATVNTFGFGYTLESDLLDQIARECDGSYVFIPDSSFVGTAFINATANLYTVMAKNVIISLAPTSGLEVDVVGGHQVQETSWGKTIRIGNVRFDQSRDIIFTLKNLPAKKQGDTLITALLDYTVVSTQKSVKKEAIVLDTDFDAGNKDNDAFNYIQRHAIRSKFVDAIEKVQQDIATGSDEKFLKHVKTIKDLAMAWSSTIDPAVAVLLEDANGQVVEALSSEECYAKWGKHYLPSLADAHRSQVCNNFKDPGVQGYGGPLFNALRDSFDEAFNTLPPPKPSRKGTRSGPVNMNAYNYARGPCFHGDSLVQMGNTYRKVSDVRKGDFVTTLGGNAAQVLCVIRTAMNGGEAELVKFPGGLLITPYHPVYDNGSWKFPIDLHKASYVPCDAVYSFVLATVHSMMINGVACITLGHGITEGAADHPYFGTDLVLQDLRTNEGWKDGIVECKNLVRDPATGLICKMELEQRSSGYARPAASKPIPIRGTTTAF